MAQPTTSILLNSSTPAAPAGDQNAKPQTDGATPLQSISFYPKRMVGDTGSGGLAGTVPPPAAGDAAANKYLKADGTWTVPSSGGLSGSLGFESWGSDLNSTGTKAFLSVPYDCTITGWALLADVAGTATIGIGVGTQANYPTVASIVGSTPPALSGSQPMASSSTLTGWTTVLTEKQVLVFSLPVVPTGIGRMKLQLTVIRK